jgi:hypothetical protein
MANIVQYIENLSLAELHEVITLATARITAFNDATTFKNFQNAITTRSYTELVNTPLDERGIKCENANGSGGFDTFYLSQNASEEIKVLFTTLWARDIPLRENWKLLLDGNRVTNIERG